MEKRLLLAVVLMAAAMLITNTLFPPPEPPEQAVVATESQTPAPTATAPVATALPAVPTTAVAGDSIVVESDLYRFVFGSVGAGLLKAELLGYSSYSDPDGSVQLVPAGAEYLSYAIAVGGDTIPIASLPFTTNVRNLRVTEASDSLLFSYVSPDGFAVSLRYTFDPDEYLVQVSGRVSGLGGRTAVLLTGLGPGMELHEHPDHHSERELAVVTGIQGSVDRLAFRRIEERSPVASELLWAGIKDKYFVAAVIGGDAAPLQGAVIEPAEPSRQQVGDTEVLTPRVELISQVPVSGDGSFAFAAYFGPQDYGRLAAIGYGLEDVTPYGYRWLQPVIRPLAAAVLWVLNTLHDTLGLAYGWVLVVFGVLMRIVLWPLNAKAMRAQMKNMGVQPLLEEIRTKYKNDPQKQQEAMLGLYKEHGFNPFAGCLPLLVPFPVLITLFFVFQNTIAFRGANFLWLPDLSLPDPLYLLPIILVVSMFALQWVMAHLSGMEQNPQMKMMMYFMPLMMGVIFFVLPAGLNLYYAVNQVASIPQQVLISKERRRASEELKKSGGAPKLAPSATKPTKPKAKR